jgi:outer membrane protein OmpA-like peptidoglycan-associated protein
MTTPNLLDAVNAQITPDVVGAVARDTGASLAEVSLAVKHATPIVLAGLIRAGSSEAGAARLLARATDSHSSGLLERLPSFGRGPNDVRELGASGDPLLGSLFGDRVGMLAKTVAERSGSRPEVAGRVLSVGAPIALGVIHREAEVNRLGPRDLSQLLADHDREVRATATRTTTPEVTVTDAPAPSVAMRRPAVVGARRRSFSWIPWAVLGVLALAVVLATSSRRRPEVGVSMPTRESVVQAPPYHPMAPPNINVPEVRKPTDEKTSETTTTGAEMAEPSAPTPEKAETPSYAVHFQFGSLAMTNDGDEQVKKIADALNASPDSRVKLSGNTDSVGDPQSNDRLALERAVVVRKQLVGEGIDNQRIDVAAHGERQPAAVNDTAEGRAENRRVDASIVPATKK